MDLGQLSEDAYLALLRRLQGSGYSADPQSNRDQELRAVARIAETSSKAIAAATRNLFFASADDALEALERVRFLAGAALSLDRRRRRLVAFAQGAGKLVPARLKNAFASYLGDATGTTLAPDMAAAVAHQASPFSTLVVGRREPQADKSAQRDLEPILSRGLPSRALSGGVSTADLTYGVSTEALLSIGVTPLVTVAPQTKARCGPVAVYPGALVGYTDWLEIQALLLWKSHGFSLDQTQQGTTTLFRGELGAGATATISAGTSFAVRFLQAWGTVSASADDDLTVKTASEHVWLAPVRLGEAASPATVDLLGLDESACGVTLTLDGDANLIVTNANPAPRHLHLLVRSTPTYEPLSSSDTQPWFDPYSVSRADLERLYASTIITDGAVDTFAGAPAGALRRVLYTGGLTRELGAGSVRQVILDSSEDWRDRYVLVVPITFAVGSGLEPAHYPEAGSEGLVPRSGPAQAPRLCYTGPGAIAGSEVAEAYQHPDSLAAPNVWLFADQRGNLIAEMKAASVNKSACLMALVVATEKRDGSSVVTPVPVHTTHVQTLDLEQPQNCGVYAQGFQGGVPRYALTDPLARAVPTCPPLGLIREGALPARPVSFTVRERLGAIADGTYEVRQPIFGQRKRLVSIEAPPHALVPVDDFNVPTELAPTLNDQLDFRDRFVWFEGRASTSDIRVESGSDDDVLGIPFAAFLYTGPYEDVEVSITETIAVFFAFSRSVGGYHSRLCLRNTGDVPVYVNASIECSGHLGLTDLRAYGVVHAFTYSSEDAEPVDDENLGYLDEGLGTGGTYTSNLSV